MVLGEVKKKSKIRGLVPSLEIDRTAIAKARIQRRGLRVSVPENAKAAKREGGRAEAAFSLFGALRGIFGFLNEKVGAKIPVFDEKKGNVKLATNRSTNITVADNKNSVTLDVSGRTTICKVNDQSPVKI